MVHLFIVVMEEVEDVETVTIVVVVVEIGIEAKDLVPVVIGIEMAVANIKTTLVDADIHMSVRSVMVITRDRNATKEQK